VARTNRKSDIATKRQIEKKNQSMTLRLNSAVVSRLKREASQKQISANTLVAQVLTDYVDWYSNAAKAGFLAIRKRLLAKLLEKVSEEEIISIAEYAANNETKDFVLMLRNEYNITSSMDVMETWIKICGYPYRHDIEDSRHHYVIEHDTGKKWSFYLAELYRFLFQDFGLREVDFDLTGNTVSFTVDAQT
jgi:predicted transcriptional regulator